MFPGRQMPRVAAVLAGMLVALSPPARSQTSDTVGAAVTAAQVAARSWLTLVDRGTYGESWDSGAAFFRKAVTKPAWEDAVRKARVPFGPFSRRQLLGASYRTVLPQAPPGEYVVLEYRTAAGGGKTVIETVTPMKDKDGHWRVAGYFVRVE
jgi:hypothetical protein